MVLLWVEMWEQKWYSAFHYSQSGFLQRFVAHFLRMRRLEPWTGTMYETSSYPETLFLPCRKACDLSHDTHPPILAYCGLRWELLLSMMKLLHSVGPSACDTLAWSDDSRKVLFRLKPLHSEGAVSSMFRMPVA